MLVRDRETGAMRPYDPDLDYDLPLQELGQLPPDPSEASAPPLNPWKDLK